MTKVTAGFRMVSTALIAATTFGPLSGCDQAEDPVNAAFQEAVYGVREYKANAHSVYIKAPDGTLLRITQSIRESGHINKKFYQFDFSKSAEGYAEYGAKATVAGYGGGVDWSKGFVFKRINMMEALALFDNDWTKLAYPVYDQFARLKTSVHPSVGTLLYAVSKPDTGPETVKMNFPNMFLGQFESGLVPTWTKELQDNLVDRAEFNAWVFNEKKITSIEISDQIPRHAYMVLDNKCMLRMTQTGNKLVFGVTSSGYGVRGGEISTPKFGLGGEEPTAFRYTTLEPLAILALVDNDWQRIVRLAERQSQIFGISVDPILVSNTLKPLVEKEPGLKLVGIAQGANGKIKINPNDDEVGLAIKAVRNLDEIYPARFFNSDQERLGFVDEILKFGPEKMNRLYLAAAREKSDAAAKGQPKAARDRGANTR